MDYDKPSNNIYHNQTKDPYGNTEGKHKSSLFRDPYRVGKGDYSRIRFNNKVSREKYEKNWDKIFGKGQC